MLLEDLFDIADIVRLVFDETDGADLLTTIRLRLTSKRLLAQVIAAGYNSGGKVRCIIDEVDGKKRPHYCSWSLRSLCVYGAFCINLEDPLFLYVPYWYDLVPTFRPYVFSHNWTFNISGCFQCLAPRTISISHRFSGRLMDAIYGALAWKRGWFISFLLSPAWANDKLVNTHYLALEYALRWDKPKMLAKHVQLFLQTEIEECLAKAMTLDKMKLLYWFMENSMLLNLTKRELMVRIMKHYTQRIETGSLDIGSPVLYQLIQHCHLKQQEEEEQARTRKRKAEEELPREEPAKSARVEEQRPM